MTVDMSNVEIMGPNPQHMYETLKVQAQKINPESSEWSAFTDSIQAVVTGKVDGDLGSVGLYADAAALARAINTSTMLGSATLSAVSDLGSLITNTAYHGLNPFGVMKNFIKHLNPKSHDEAIRMGLGADVFNSEITQRFSELGSKGFWSRASEALMRATFMNIWTEAGRKSFQVEYMHKLLKGRKTTDLSQNELINMLAEVQEQADYAVLMPTARTRAITTAGREKGTGIGETVRLSTQFQSFGITFMQQHGARMFMQGSVGSRLAYGSSILTVSTLLGSVAMMLKDVSKGFTPREGFDVTDEKIDIKDNAKFWAAATLQGGGGGIIGDLLFSDQTRYGNTVMPTLLSCSRRRY